jgi:hypothetical protein
MLVSEAGDAPNGIRLLFSFPKQEYYHHVRRQSPRQSRQCAGINGSAYSQRQGRHTPAFLENRIAAAQEESPDIDPDAAMAQMFVDKAETARMRLLIAISELPSEPSTKPELTWPKPRQSAGRERPRRRKWKQ